ncbi:MAG: hypothetical protein IT423_22345 [Pirellulaceae bacterium]|nr:hypothetical protein [Pirellulaceae bacterium]
MIQLNDDHGPEQVGPVGAGLGPQPFFGQDVLGILLQPRPEVAVPEDEIVQISRLESEAEINSAAEALTARRFDLEPTRRMLLSLAISHTPGMNRKSGRLLQLVNIWFKRGIDSIGETRKALPNKRLLSIQNLPYLTRLLTGWTLVIAGFGAEFLNCLSILQMAGELEGAPTLTKLAFAAPYIMVLFGTTVLISIVPGPWIRKHVSGWIVAVLGVISIAGLLFFALRLGAYLDPDPVNPQIWPTADYVIFFATLCGAGATACGKYIISSACESLFETEIQNRVESTFGLNAAEAWAERGDDAEALAIRLQHIVTEINAERAAYVQTCITKVAIAKAYLQDLYSALRLSELPPVPGFVRAMPPTLESRHLQSHIKHSGEGSAHKAVSSDHGDARREPENGSAHRAI